MAKGKSKRRKPLPPPPVIRPPGRPPVWGEDVVKKLEDAFSIGCTISEACLYAEISREMFYTYAPKGSELHDRFIAMRDKPILLARQTVVNNLTHPDSARWYLKNKRSNEFSEKHTIKHDDRPPVRFTDEEEDLLKAVNAQDKRKN